MKKMFMIFSTVIIVLFTSCFSSKNGTMPATETRVPARFDFSPPSKADVGATGITIALIKPSFINNNPYAYVDPIGEMATSMANDFNELLTAKGFKIRGPFQSRDAMTYSDKSREGKLRNLRM